MKRLNKQYEYNYKKDKFSKTKLIKLLIDVNK